MFGRTPAPYLAGTRQFAIALIMGVSLLASFPAAEAVCKPGIVRRDGRVLPARFAIRSGLGRPRLLADLGPRQVSLRYIAHSSFLITAADGKRVLTDPYADFVVRPLPDVLTVSNYHMTHAAFGPYLDKVPIFLGTKSDGSPNLVNQRFGGIQVLSFPQEVGNAESSTVINTIFVFKVANLCIAHLGNSRFGPSPEQIRALGKIHVMLLPIDGSFTVPHEVAAKMVKRIGPNIVVPMHFFGPELPGQFGAAMREEGIERAIRSPSSRVTLSLKTLPPPTTYMVIPSEEF